MEFMMGIYDVDRSGETENTSILGSSVSGVHWPVVMALLMSIWKRDG